MFTCVYICVCTKIYICVCVEMVDRGESDKMIKTIGKMDKSDTYKKFSCDISFIIQRMKYHY